MVAHTDHRRAVLALWLLTVALLTARALVIASALRLSLMGLRPVAAFFVAHFWRSVGVASGRRNTRFVMWPVVFGIARSRRRWLAAGR